MAANAPVVQILNDEGQTVVLKVTGYYTAGDSSNTVIANTKALMFANTSQTCLLSLQRVQYATDVANGTVQLYWEGSSANTEIFNFGSSAGGSIDAYIVNNAASPTGNVGIRTISVGAGDNYSFVLRFNKEQGYANAFINYNNYGQVGA